MNPRLFLDDGLHVLAELIELCCAGIAAVDDETCVLFADLCITDTVALEPRLFDKSTREISRRSFKETARAGEFERLLFLPFGAQLTHFFGADLALAWR